MDVDLLKSINERLAKLDIFDILREDINALCASLEFSQCQIDDLRKENTVLKGPVDSIHGRVHRMSKASGNGPLAIIACFEHFKQKEMAKSRGRELRNTDFGMNDHFPTEINERRKKLYPIMKEKCCLNQRASLVMDKLYINGNLYRDSRVTPWLF
ncbi:unnamed protein product [Coregonus sp. 'balchen']|nr:unnamed protein product [Coregonus sp. 'balchen']